MKPECVEAVTKAVGRAMSAAEINGIEERIARHLRQNAAADRVATLAMTPEQRLEAAAKSAAEELVMEQAKKAQRVSLQVLANTKIEQHLAQFGNDKMSGLERVIAFHADRKGNFLSVESRTRAIERDGLRQMIGTLEASNPKFFGLFENRAGVHALVKEIFGESTGNQAAKAGAAEFKSVAEALRTRFNRSGGDVGKLDDWGIPHHHSQSKVALAGRDKWIADVMPSLKRDAYVNEDGTRMSDMQVNQFLGHAWETIATGGANKVEPGQAGGNGMRANRGNETRQIHFKNADSYLEYQSHYGDRTPYEVMTQHIMVVSKDVALVETFGPNPDHAYRYFRDAAVKEKTLAEPTAAGQIQKQAVSMDNLYNLTAGKTLPVASEHLAKTFDTLRSWLVASRLGSAVISSLSDEATMYLTAHVNNLPQLKLLSNELATLNPLNQAEKRQALRSGLAMNTLISSLNRFGQDGLGTSFSSKMGSTVMRLSGLNAITEARKRAFGVTMMSGIGQVVKDFDSLAKLDAGDHRMLLAKGITDADFNVWRKAQLEDWGGGNDTLLTPDAIYRIPDAELAAMGDPKVLKEQAATKLLGAVLEETDMAVIEPGMKERAMTQSGIQRGTWKGELTKSFFLFKSFPLAMLTRHWSRGMDMDTHGGRAAYIATLIAGTTVMGAASLQINELLNGRDPRNLNPAEKGGVRNWIQAMLKGGSLGIYGDFLFSDASQTGQSPVASFMGPVVGLGESLFNLTQGNVVQALQDKKTNLGAETVRFAKGLLPGANLWYAKAALDHMIFHQLQEYFSPGYLANMRARAEHEFGQQFWWEPGEVEPSRAPNLGAAVGE